MPICQRLWISRVVNRRRWISELICSPSRVRLPTGTVWFASSIATPVVCTPVSCWRIRPRSKSTSNRFQTECRLRRMVLPVRMWHWYVFYWTQYFSRDRSETGFCKFSNNLSSNALKVWNSISFTNKPSSLKTCLLDWVSWNLNFFDLPLKKQRSSWARWVQTMWIIYGYIDMSDRTAS